VFGVSTIGDGGDFDLSHEWPGGSETHCVAPGHECCVTVARPSGNIDLVGLLGDRWRVTGWTGFSSCRGEGGEDGDGCGTPLCNALLSVGFCEAGRPSCTSALGSASGPFSVRCDVP
jgi:hypothetical protein